LARLEPLLVTVGKGECVDAGIESACGPVDVASFTRPTVRVIDGAVVPVETIFADEGWEILALGSDDAEDAGGGPGFAEVTAGLAEDAPLSADDGAAGREVDAAGAVVGVCEVVLIVVGAVVGGACETRAEVEGTAADSCWVTCAGVDVLTTFPPVEIEVVLGFSTVDETAEIECELTREAEEYEKVISDADEGAVIDRADEKGGSETTFATEDLGADISK
jgi:hypothetical protein